MRHYSIDTDSRIKMYGILGVLSLIINGILNQLMKGIGLPSAPTSMAIFGVLVFLFDVFLWKMSIKKLNFSDIPDFNGVWIGTITRINKDQPDKEDVFDVTLFITQNWQKISLDTKTNHTRSSSRAVHINNGNQMKLIEWTYLVEDTSGISKDNKYGSGVTNLELTNKGGRRVLEGMYYSSKLRQGSFSVTFNNK